MPSITPPPLSEDRGRDAGTMGEGAGAAAPGARGGDGWGPVLAMGQMVGHYRVLAPLGQGGMGEVYLAEHKDIERRAAIKVLYPEYARYPQLTARFLNEARAVNRVRHPGLVEIFEYGVLMDGTPYLVMEYIEGELLSQRILMARGAPLFGALELARQIALALAAAHERGIVHRDLKPNNVMVVPDQDVERGRLSGEGEVASRGRERVKVIDFGVARIDERRSAPLRADTERISQTMTGVTLGTPQYMAPEQCLGQRTVDGKADVYSLGVMVYEMLSGRLPFEAEQSFDYMALHVRAEPAGLLEVVPGVGVEVAGLCHQMLAKDPARRPGMLDVARALLRLCETAPRGAGAELRIAGSGDVSVGGGGVAVGGGGVAVGGGGVAVVAARPEGGYEIAPGPDAGLSPTLLLRDGRRREGGVLGAGGREGGAAGAVGGGVAARPRRVLVIDDDADLLSVMLEYLGEAGFWCRGMGSSGEALEAVLRDRPDVVLLDVVLPGKSGYKLCWEIKTRPETRDTLVVLLSGKSLAADQKMGLAMQADAYIAKPFELSELLSVMQLLLDHPG